MTVSSRWLCVYLQQVHTVYLKPIYVHKVGRSVPQFGVTLHASTDCPVLLRQQLHPSKQPSPQSALIAQQ